MILFGQEIPATVVDALVDLMRKRPFTAKTIETAAIELGVRKREGYRSPANRVADRIIQAQRKAGNIRFDGREWHWCAVLTPAVAP